LVLRNGAESKVRDRAVMHRHAVAAMAALALVVVVPLDAAVPPADRTPTPSIVIVGATDEDARIVLDAVARFAAAGMALPDLEVRILARCQSGQGMFLPDESAVEVCLVSEHLLVHEMGHAWEHAHVDEATRERFMVAAGAESWRSSATIWRLRGIEMAANVIADSLSDAPLSQNDLVDGGDEMLFELLTGHPSPRRSGAAERSGQAGGRP
jgi:hypothetical protein